MEAGERLEESAGEHRVLKEWLETVDGRSEETRRVARGAEQSAD